MKIHKENVKLFFKDKKTITSLVLLFVFLCSFLITFFDFATSIKGITEVFNTTKIEKIFSNNYSVIYAVDDENTLFYSYNRSFKGHLNTHEGVESLDFDYGDATSHHYNFLSVSHKFDSEIIKVDGFRDNSFGLNGYTLVLTKNKNLFVLYDHVAVGAPLIKLASNIRDFDVGYANFSVITTTNEVYEYINKDAYFYRIDTQAENIKYVSNQGHKKDENDNYCYTSYYVDENDIIYQNKITLNYTTLHAYETKQITKEVKEIENITNIYKKETIYFDRIVDSICSIENSTFVLTKDDEIYAIGDNYIDDDIGIFGIDEKINYNHFKKLDFKQTNIKKIYTSGPFGLFIVTKKGYYYSGNVGFDNTQCFKKLTQFKEFDYLISSFNTTIIIENDVIYYVDYDNNNKVVRMYNSFFVGTILRYVLLFLTVMTLFYVLYYFYEENRKYNRYFKRRYENENHK